MFQLATAYAFALENNIQFVMLPKSIYYTYYKDPDCMDTIFRKFKILQNPDQSWDMKKEKDNQCLSHSVFPSSKSDYILFHGYFQNEKYFNKYKQKIIDMFEFPNITYPIKPNSIFLHIRRGDYTLIKMHGGMDYSTYYRNALQYCIDHITQLENVLICSDDLDWCRNWSLLSEFSNLKFEFVNLAPLETMQMMRQCDLGGICANSSFSWWGAYLNSNPNAKFLFPDQWFFDLPGSSWSNDIVFEGGIKIKTKL
jgi:hypothetical protein